MQILDWSEQYATRAMTLLAEHESTSLFLLSNLENYGPKLTATDSYSADYKIIVNNDKVVAVFALTNIGNLLVQTDRENDYTKIIVEECLHSPIQFIGVVADWELAKPIWDCLKLKCPNLREKTHQKEILFQLNLEHLATKNSLHLIRHLNLDDFQAWDTLNTALLNECNLNQNETIQAKHKRFATSVLKQNWLGLFIDNKLVSTATFISHVNNVGQIGGVYTAPHVRQQGLANELIYQLLLDGKNNKQMNKAILFTRENNYPAINMYEKLGFSRIGHFGLLFGTVGTVSSLDKRH